MTRKSIIKRKTRETDIELSLNVDGSGKFDVKTPIPFFTHMMEAFARHGFFDLKLKAKGDVDVDDHHLVEDVGLVLGEALKKALGKKEGIQRYGHFMLPMDEVLTAAAIDLSGRPCLMYDVKIPSGKIKNFEIDLAHEFFQAVVNSAGMNLHLEVIRGGNKHHLIESLFKGFARALAMAVAKNPRAKGVQSTKGMLS